MNVYYVPMDGRTITEYQSYVSSLDWVFNSEYDRSINIDYNKEYVHASAFLGGFELIEEVPPDNVIISELDKKINDINNLRDVKLSRFAYDTGTGIYHLQLRDEYDRSNWLTLDLLVGRLVNAGQGATLIDVRTEENITLTMSATQVANMLTGMAQYGASVLKRSWELKDDVRAAPSPELVDITVGW